MKKYITLCLLAFLVSAANAFAQSPRKTRRSTPRLNTSRPTDFDKFIGVWEFAPKYSVTKGYFKITEVQPRRFRFVQGFEYQGNITWAETTVNHADGIYLKPLNGKLAGQFTSPDFRATHGHDFTYRVTLSLESDDKLIYSVFIGAEAEIYPAAKVNDGEDTGEVAVPQGRAAASIPETLMIVPTGENAPEAIVRVLSATTISPGKQRVEFAGGPCRSQSNARPVYVVVSKETLAKGDLFFRVPVSSPAGGFALRRADSREAAQYASCQWR